jgi:segregation and condensation protein B
MTTATQHPEQLAKILEAAIMVAGRPLSVSDLQKLFDEEEQPGTKEIRAVLETIQENYTARGIELREVASGFQFQAKMELSTWLSRLWEERAPRYSRALMETLALITYRQPITRAEIEEIRGVTVSTNIIKILQDREWIRVIGYRETPGKPALYATTKTFLDHLSLKSLSELPALTDLKDLESQEEKLQVQLELAASSQHDNVEENTDDNREENISELAVSSQNDDTDECIEDSSEKNSDEREASSLNNNTDENREDSSEENSDELEASSLHDDIDGTLDDSNEESTEREASFLNDNTDESHENSSEENSDELEVSTPNNNTDESREDSSEESTDPLELATDQDSPTESSDRK